MTTSTEFELRRAEAATWGPRLGAGPEKPKIRLLAWNAVVKNSLRGFVDVELASGLVIRDVSIHEKACRWWASLPAKPQFDQDGRHRCSPDGKPLYASILQWRSRDLSDRFSAAVIALVRADHPGALDGAGP